MRDSAKQRFSRKIRNARKALGFDSARAFSDQHDWDERTWYRIESGERQTYGPEELHRMARDLKMTIIFDGKDEPE